MKKEKRPIEHRANDDFNRTFRGKQDKAGPLEWLYQGADLQDRIHDWAEKWPQDVAICGIDDSHFTSSDVVFILHRKGKKLWGTTVYVITQCDGQPPMEFFMYPGHARWMERALSVMNRFDPWDHIGGVIRQKSKKQKAKYFGKIV